MRILSMSGFIPEQVCDTVRFRQYNGIHGISHYCGYASDFISQVLDDDSIDGAVFPKSCDSSRVLGSYCEHSGKFLYQMAVPARYDRAAVQYFAHSIEEYRKAVERHYGITISEKFMRERNERIRLRNGRLRECYDDLEQISYGSYLDAIHEMLQMPLMCQEVPALPEYVSTFVKRVYLVGSFCSNSNLAYRVEKAGMKIVGDNLTESKRLFSMPILNAGENIYEELAEGILGNRLSPTQNRFADMLQDDLREIRAKKVNAVIFATQKYCEPYDYLYSVYKKALDSEGIPVLKLTCANSTDQSDEELAIEAFSDMLQEA